MIQTNKWLKDSEITEIQEWVKKEVEESVTFAENSPYPEGKDLYDDIYKEPNYPYIIEY
jgi:pyruvate dehydrogenase E1 component alpha subunit